MWGGSLTTTELVALVQSAKRSVKIQTPYLVTSELGLGLFEDAVARGVKVEILTNSLPSTDNLMAFGGYIRNRQALLDIGVDIYEFRPDAEIRKKRDHDEQVVRETGEYPTFGLHAKTMVVDDEMLIGNLQFGPTKRQHLNTECFVKVQNSEMASKVVRYFDLEIQPANTWKVTAETNGDQHAPLSKRIKLFFFELFRAFFSAR